MLETVAINPDPHVDYNTLDDKATKGSRNGIGFLDNENMISKSLDDMISDEYGSVLKEDATLVKAHTKSIKKMYDLFSPGIKADDNQEYGPPSIIQPIIPLKVLRSMAQSDVMVSKCVNVGAITIGGGSWYSKPKVNVTETEDENGNKILTRDDTGEIVPAEFMSQINAQQDRMNSFFKRLTARRMTYRKQREERVRSLWEIGNAFWECVRSASGEPGTLCKIEDETTIYLCEKDKKASKLTYKYIEGTLVKEEQIPYTFRRYVQIKHMKKTFFKEYGDKRRMCADSGRYLGKSETVERIATELIHFKMPGLNYGIPPFFANIIGLQTGKGAKVSNRETMNNGGMPKMIALITNSNDPTIEKDLEKKFKKIKQSGSREKILIVRLAPEMAGAGPAAKPVTPGLEFMPFSDLQEKEGMFLELLAYIDKDSQTCYGVPDILVGRGNDFNRATAYEAKDSFEQLTARPMRLDFDEWINEYLLPEKDLSYHTYHSHDLAIKDVDSMIELIKIFTDSGALIPDDLRRMAEKLIDHALEDMSEPWAQVPKHIAVIRERLQEQARLAEAKDSVSQGQGQEQQTTAQISMSIPASPENKAEGQESHFASIDDITDPMIKVYALMGQEMVSKRFQGMKIEGYTLYQPKECKHD